MEYYLDLLAHQFTNVVIVILFILLIKTIFSKSTPHHHSHWNILLDTPFSTMDFFEILKDKIKDAGVHGINFDLQNLKEGNFTFTKRKYLDIQFKDFSFLVSASPFGKGYFFISYWGRVNKSFGESIIRFIPVIGNYVADKIYSYTYHKHDTCSSFLTLLNHCVKEAMEEVTKQKGIDMPVINKPILNDFFKR